MRPIEREVLRRLASLPGLPRPFLRLSDGRRLPLPWVNGSNPVDEAARYAALSAAETSRTAEEVQFDETYGWKMYENPKPVDALRGRTCFFCGEAVPESEVIVYLRYEPSDRDGLPLSGLVGESQLTDGPGGHARCACFAVKFCPHVSAQPDVVAYAWPGDGPGVLSVDEVGEIVKWHSRTMLPLRPGAIPLRREDLRALARDPRKAT